MNTFFLAAESILFIEGLAIPVCSAISSSEEPSICLSSNNRRSLGFRCSTASVIALRISFASSSSCGEELARQPCGLFMLSMETTVDRFRFLTISMQQCFAILMARPLCFFPASIHSTYLSIDTIPSCATSSASASLPKKLRPTEALRLLVPRLYVQTLLVSFYNINVRNMKKLS